MSLLDLSADARLDTESARRILQRAVEADVSLEIGAVRGWGDSWMRSRFLSEGDSGGLRIRVLTPLGADGSPQVREGEHVLVYWTLGGSGYALEGRVDALHRAHLPTGVATHATRIVGSGVYRHQRREYLRVRPVDTLAVEVWLDDPEIDNWPLQGRAPDLAGHVEDLSLGGLRLRVEGHVGERASAFARGAAVRLSLWLGPGAAIGYATAEVVRTRLETHPRRVFWLSAQWRALTEEQRSALAKYVHEAERQMLRARQASALRDRGRGS